MTPTACWRMVRTYLDVARLERRLGSRAGRIMALAEARYWAARAHGLDFDAAIAVADRTFRRAA